MKQLPRFTASGRFNSNSSQLWNNLVDEVDRLRKLTVGHGLNMQSNAAGLSISLDTSVFPKNVGEISHVALVKDPQEDDKLLTVRKVSYKETKLEDDETPYEWSPEEDIQASPDFGLEPLDYQGMFWDTDTDPEPTLSTPFLKLQRNYQGRMILWIPGTTSEFKFAVVRDVGSGNQLFVLAQAVRFIAAYGFVTVGEAREVATYPGTWSKYYEPFIWVGQAINLPDTPLLRVFSVDGENYIEQSVRWAARKSVGNLHLSDCTPVERVT